PRLAVDHAAHHHVADARRIHLRAGYGFLDGNGAEASRRKVLQRAAVIADRRARSRNHHYLAVAHCALPCKSCSPECSIRTAANSPTLARPLKRTTPSISGASALERPSPGSSTRSEERRVGSGASAVR